MFQTEVDQLVNELDHMGANLRAMAQMIESYHVILVDAQRNLLEMAALLDSADNNNMEDVHE